MKIGLNRDINKDRKRFPVTPLPPKIVIPTVWYDPVEATKLHYRKMLTEKPSDQKLAITLLIVGAGMNDYHFW